MIPYRESTGSYAFSWRVGDCTLKILQFQGAHQAPLSRGQSRFQVKGPDLGWPTLGMVGGGGKAGSWKKTR